MKYHITLETAISVTKCLIAPIACWPLRHDASNLLVLRRRLWWWFGLIHFMISSPGWFYNMYENRHDVNVIIRISAEVTCIVATVTKMIICKISGPSLQVLLAAMQKFVKTATSEELEMIQLYVDKCSLFHVSILSCSLFCLLIYIVGPLITSTQPLPGDTSYPFSIEPLWIWIILYISHAFLIMQVGSMIFLDFMYAILIWFAGARFEMLSTELQRATNDSDVTRCIRKHQELLEYVAILRDATVIVALQVTLIAIVGLVSGGYVIICMQNPPLEILLKLVFYEGCTAIQLFLFTWPADHLLDMNEGVGVAAYSCDWIGKSPMMVKDLLVIAQRTQSPPVIAIKGVLPTLCLKFYGSVISASFSYLTTLRAFVGDQNGMNEKST